MFVVKRTMVSTKGLGEQWAGRVLNNTVIQEVLDLYKADCDKINTQSTSINVKQIRTLKCSDNW